MTWLVALLILADLFAAAALALPHAADEAMDTRLGRFAPVMLLLNALALIAIGVAGGCA